MEKRELLRGIWAQISNEKKTNGFNKSLLKCDKKEDCHKQNEGNFPCYSGLWGDDDTNVMVIAEAPSAGAGNDLYLDQETKEFPSDISKLDDQESCLEFIKKRHKKMPYFTDIIKCGLAKQNDKTALATRLKFCPDKFLKKEIEILKPEYIYCIGKTAQNYIKELKKKTDLLSNVVIINMLHYGKQANLPINKEDKRKIWDLQLSSAEGKLDKEKLIDAITQLSFFKKLSDGDT